MQQEFAERWNWYSVIKELAGGDLTRMDEMAELNVYTVLNDQAYLAQKLQLEDTLRKQNSKK